jgi:Family of unknown function (DUF6176)
LKFLNVNMDELEDGLDITKNDHWISKKHLEYSEECIASSFGFVDLSTEVVMIPKDVRKSMV